MARRSHRSLSRRPVSAGRSVLLRVFAVLVALLALSAQQRVRTVVAPASGSATRVVRERVEASESNALRSEASQRVAPAPVLARLPIVALALFGSRSPSARWAFAPAVGLSDAQVVTHFHAKRRIPRMNSEEPPRA